MLRHIALGSALTFAAFAAFAGGLTGASASTVTGTFDVTVYQGSGHGDGNNANNQANKTNPLINNATKLGTGTYSGALNLDLGANDTDKVGAFFASDGSSLVGCGVTCLNAVLSTANYGTTSVFVITGNTNGATWSGTIDHDDGVSLYDGAGFSNLVVGSASPTVDIPTTFTGLTGAFLSWSMSQKPTGCLLSSTWKYQQLLSLLHCRSSPAVLA